MAKTKLTGTVLTYWEDLQDNDRAYNMRDTFPHAEVGYEVTDERMHELASKHNKRGQKLININESAEETEEVTDPYADLTVTELKELAKERELEGYSKLNREDLIALLEK
ncbi:Rho termination factor N-terminal domain-containing protein [Macrococcus bovicus]|uniref:Rho termination protein n=1 Tax=Macrococcus bovicus TaxID=69968 RepID=A0A4R6BWK3_9STAP|nr:Rho termination factor N-terminal domain-containing protein [Macrococcus bovicus]TDM12661.1 Rho termination protein [Macrococcus bovicus]